MVDHAFRLGWPEVERLTEAEGCERRKIGARILEDLNAQSNEEWPRGISRISGGGRLEIC